MTKFKAVLFDCDGVLVDSEPITNGVLRDMLAEIGWQMTPQECWQRFVGHTVRSQKDEIEQHTGKPFSEEWLQTFMNRRNRALQEKLMVIQGIPETVTQLHQRFQGRIAVASGADRFKVEMMLQQVGLFSYFEDRIFSGHEMPRSKPHPDVYLAAANQLGVDPEQCLVVEDTAIGVCAGVAAGATVWGYAVMGQEESLRAAGAQQIFNDMNQLLTISSI
jgi:HAD superfamily hydrolase (TIGR01509 family)